MADSKIPLSDLPAGVPGAYDKVAGVDTATGASRLFPLPQPGVPQAYATRASLPAAGGLAAGTAAWVTNDPNPLLNGTWSVQAGAWVQSADRVTGLEGRTAAVEAGVFDLNAATFVIEPVTFEQGGFSTTTGSEANSTTIIRSPFIADRFISVTCSPTQQVALLRYSATGAYLGWSGWQSSIPATAIERARVMVRNVGSTPLVPADGTAVIKVDRMSVAEALLTTLDTMVIATDPSPFVQGGFNTTNGSEAASSTALRGPFIDANFATVTCAPTQNIAVLHYTSAGAYLGWTGWQAGVSALPVERFRVMVRKVPVPSAAIVPAENTAVVQVDRLGGAESRITAVEEDVAAVDSLMWVDSTPTFEQGGFSTGDGSEAGSTTLIRSPFMEAALLTITIAPTQWVGVLHYSETGAYLGWTGWQTGVQTLPVGRFRIMVRNTDGSPLVPAGNTAVVTTNRFVAGGGQSSANVPSSPEGLLDGKLWSNALSITKARAYPEIYGGGQRIVGGHAGVYAIMDDLASEFSDYITRSEIGQSELGKPIYQYRLTPGSYVAGEPNSHPYSEVALPKMILNAGIHGDELTSVKATLIYIEELCRNWREYPMLEEIRWGVDLIYVPLVNPDGYDAGTLGTRHNANDVNINRDFQLQSQSETRALSSVFLAHPDAIACIDRHDYGPVSVAGYSIWVGCEGPQTLGPASELIRQMVAYARKRFASIDYGNAPIAKFADTIGNTTATGYCQHTLGLDAWLVESPNTLMPANSNTDVMIHSREMLARMLRIVYQREMRRRMEHFDLS